MEKMIKKALKRLLKYSCFVEDAIVRKRGRRVIVEEATLRIKDYEIKIERR